MSFTSYIGDLHCLRIQPSAVVACGARIVYVETVLVCETGMIMDSCGQNLSWCHVDVVFETDNGVGGERYEVKLWVERERRKEERWGLSRYMVL